MKKPLLDPTKKLYFWGPIPGRFFYISDFMENVRQIPEKFPRHRWPRAVFLFRDGQMVWINENDLVIKEGWSIFVKYMLPEAEVKKVRQEYDQAKKRLAEIEQKIDSIDLSAMTSRDLAVLYTELVEGITRMGVTTMPVELGNWAAEVKLKERLAEILSDQNKLNLALEVLTAPEELSFYQEEEIALAKCRDIKAHQQKYFWLKNNYAGVKILPVNYFARRKKEIQPGFEQNQKRRLAEVKKGKAALIQELEIPGSIIFLAQRISQNIAWQDDRKRHIFIYLHYKEQFLNEAARRSQIPADDLRNAGWAELKQVIEGDDLGAALKARWPDFGLVFKDDSKYLNPAEVKKCWSLFVAQEIKAQTKVFKGVVASRGSAKKVRGRVRILTNPEKLDSFIEGEILVAPMTSPEYVFAMKKAAAVVTDAGGLTSHAAIVSRELGIPCLVDTKVATKSLTNGQEIVVDTQKGLIRVV